MGQITTPCKTKDKLKKTAQSDDRRKNSGLKIKEEKSMEKFAKIMENLKNLPSFPPAYERAKENRRRIRDISLDDLDAIKDESERQAAENAEIERVERVRKILKHNAKIALVAENLPAILAIWNKYAGKRIGEKTERKISDEIHETLGLFVTLRMDYARIRCYICTDIRRDISVEVYGKYDTSMWDGDGKLRELSPDMFDWDKSAQYIDDPEAWIAEKLAALDEIKAERERLSRKIYAYNRGLPEGFREVEHNLYGNTYFD